MVDLHIDGELLRIEMRGHHKLWALKSTLSVPLSDIREVRRDPERARRFWKGFGLPATHAPGVYSAGTFYESDLRPDFWSVRDPDKALVIQCALEAAYDEIIVEVEDPAADLERLLEALGRRA